MLSKMSDSRKLDDLPPEILNIILGFLKHGDLKNVARVNRKLYRAANNPKFWENFKFIHTDPANFKFLLKLERFSQVKSLVIKRSVNRTKWSQNGPNLGIAVLGTVVEKFEELDLSGVDLTKKQIARLFDKLLASPLTVLKKLRIFCKFDSIPADVFGKSLSKIGEVDLGYHRINEPQQNSLFENMVQESKMKRLILHDNIIPNLSPGLVANALKNLEELFLFGLSESQTLALFEELATYSRMKVLTMDNKNLKCVPPALLVKVVAGLEKIVFFDHLNDLQTTALFEEMARTKSKLKCIRLDGHGMAKVKPTVFARALNTVEEVDISYANLTKAHKTALFEQMAQESKVKKLNMMSINLSSVRAATLAKAVVGLVEAELSYTHLTSEQVNMIFEHLGEKKEPKLKLFNLVGNNLRSVAPHALAEGFNRVETTNLSDTRIDGEQVKAVLEEMVRKTRLKKIKMEFSDVCEYENSLVAEARKKGVYFIIEEEDELN